MDKELKQHELFITKEIDKIKAELDDTRREREIETILKDVKDLIKYNNDMTRNFQHERFIHLIVTFFFASLLIFSITASFSVMFNTKFYESNFINGSLMTINFILAVTEGFYIRHYYVLENHTQNLYKTSKDLYLIIKSYSKI